MTFYGLKLIDSTLSKAAQIKKAPILFKYFLALFGCIIFANAAKCATADTAVFFYKYDLTGYHKVETKEFCDFFRVITSAEEGDNTYSIKEYYQDGHIKFVGKAPEKLLNNSGFISLEGECIGFFESGKRQSITHYQDGYIDGDEYLFYPTGKIYQLRKNPFMGGHRYSNTKYWECYDTDGKMLCKDGDGQWIDYDRGFNTIVLQGTVRNGEKDGEWHGRLLIPDSIKFTKVYKNGLIKSTVGYDKNGRAYPCEDDIELASYWSGPFNFLRAVQTNLVLPRDLKGKKMLADSVRISFIVEKDGHLTHFGTLQEVDPYLKLAIKTALYKCRDWTPRKNYGVPVRAKIWFSMYYKTYTTDRWFVDEIHHDEQQISDYDD
jgi:antitoxin component YwqK of YwqJK toxin-antitoxin module